MQAVFSAGQVWPPVRVGEGWRQGLDAFSITNHIGYQPHKDDLPPNHGQPYGLVLGSAKAQGGHLLCIQGREKIHVSLDRPASERPPVTPESISEQATARQCIVSYLHSLKALTANSHLLTVRRKNPAKVIL